MDGQEIRGQKPVHVHQCLGRMLILAPDAMEVVYIVFDDGCLFIGFIRSIEGDSDASWLGCHCIIRCT